MRISRKLGRGLILAAAVLGAALPVAARAQVMADKVPADAVAYAGWGGSDALGAAYGNSHLKGFLETLGLQAYVQKQLDRDVARAPAEQAQEAKLLQQWLTAIGKSPTAFYLGAIDLPGVTLPVDAEPVPHLALFSKVGKETADALAEKLDAAMQRNAGPGVPLHRVVAVGEYLLLYVGDDGMVARLKGAGGSGGAGAENLAGSENFKKALAAAGATPNSAAVLYADGEAFTQMVNQAMQHANLAQARALYPAIAQGLGINQIKQMAWAGNFDGPNWSGGGFLGMGEARHGLLAFLDSPPLSDASLKLIPASATVAGAFRFDAMRLLADVKETAGAIDPKMPAQLETVLKQAYAWTGVDFTKELFPALGDEFIYYGTPGGTGNSLLGFTVVNRLRDAKLGESALTAAQDFTNLLILQRDPNSKLQFRDQELPAPFDKVKAHVMTTESVQPAWAIMDGTLFVSLSVQGLENAMEMATLAGAGAAKKPTLLENPQFAAAWKKLGSEKFSSFTFADLEKSAPESYQIAARALARAKAESPDPADIGLFTLPPLDRLMPDLGPSLRILWTSKEGLHERDTGPFPMAGYLAPTTFLSMRVAEMIQAQRGPAGGGRGAGGGGGAGALP